MVVETCIHTGKQGLQRGSMYRTFELFVVKTFRVVHIYSVFTEGNHYKKEVIDVNEKQILNYLVNGL